MSKRSPQDHYLDIQPENPNRQSQISTISDSGYGAYTNKGFYSSNLSIGADTGPGYHHDKKSHQKQKQAQPVDRRNSDMTYQKENGCSRCKIALIVISVIIAAAVIAFLIVWFVVLPMNKTTSVTTTSPSTTLPPTPSSHISDFFEVSLPIQRNWSDELLDKTSSASQSLMKESIDLIDSIFQKSDLASDYSNTTVFSFRRNGSSGIKAFLHLRLKSGKKREDVTSLIVRGLKDNKSSSQLAADIIEAGVTVIPIDDFTGSNTPRYTDMPRLKTTSVPGTCQQLQIDECKKFGYTVTGVPNVLGRTHQTQSRSTLYHWLSVGDTQCYPYTELFACSFLYPKCDNGRIISACRSFCNAFQRSCKLPFEGCNKLYDDDDPNMCILAPNAEKETPPVPPNNPCGGGYWCGDGSCVAARAHCDGRPDCPDSSDEVNCPGIVSQLDCDFDSSSTCAFTQSKKDDFDWIIHKGSTGSAHTGPHWDHTTRTTSGAYLLMEASGRYWDDKAILESPRIDIYGEHCLRFYFHMRGSQVDSLKVVLEYSSVTKSVVWRRSGHQGDDWRFGQVSLPAGDYRIIFEATRGEGYLGDIAIDDISLRKGKCVGEMCASDEHRCLNAHCVLKQYVCNRQNECGDYSDESDCECNKDEFQCNMGLCIPSYHRCDGNFQCPDNSDELQCVCPTGQYQCPSGHCIMREWLCDRQEDCSDGSDEHNCTMCPADQFQCHDHNCVPGAQRCDGTAQCVDLSDEKDCAKLVTDNVVNILSDHGDGQWLEMCSQGTTDKLAADICTHLGNMEVSSQSYVFKQGNGPFLLMDGNDSQESFLSKLRVVSSCPEGKIMTLKCQPFSCGVPTVMGASSYIINGQDAAPGEWPWHVALYNGLYYLCGGTLISTHHVITAAHCLDQVQNGEVQLVNIYVKLGSNRADQQAPLVRNVKKYLVHQNYQLERYYWGNDLAVLILDQEVPFSDKVKPICLPEEDHTFHWTSLCYTSGFGYTNKTTQTLPTVLQKAKMKLWDNEQCNVGYHGTIQDNMVCAGYTSSHITNCLGDSGGPLVCKQQDSGPWHLVGVFSFVPDQCQDINRPSVFGRVQNFLPWIREKLECVFTCDNKKCLYAEEDLCNGVNDCGDKSDERKPCSPSVQCDFEHPYQCGYYTQPGSAGQWTRGKDSYNNVGPTVDHTYGNNSGNFMFTTSRRAVLVSPVFNKTSDTCLTFHYHLRGTNAGFLRLKQHTVTLPFDPDAPLGTGASLFQVQGHQGDIWRKATLTLPRGTYVLSFEAEKTQDDTNRKAIDDVQLRDGSCSFLACIDNTFKCDGILCYPRDYMCDYKLDCDDGQDEFICPKRNYKCDFERFVRCRLEQDHLDDMDWEIINHSTELVNTPTADHSKGTDQGYFAYLDTAYSSGVGDQAGLIFNIGQLTTESCFTFFYNMLSNSSLSVYVEMGATTELKWKVARVSLASWTEAEVQLDPGVKSVKIVGAVGPWQQGTNYIAIDDIQIISGKCKSSNCQEGQIECANGQCISATFWCNGFDECGDMSDEPQGCTCRDEQYSCSSGLCIPGYKYCDGTPDCGDSSDEFQGCSCDTMWTFKCPNAENLCIRLDQVCDGWNNCGDLSDEKNCSCTGFRCSDGTCIKKSQYCNGSPDCIGLEDEPKDCECLDGGFKCAAGNCIPANQVCDGQTNCDDMSDETNCTCPDNWFQCDNGRCLANSKKCNEFNDCGDNSDERNCVCAPGSSKCANGMCLVDTWWCNGQDDCGDESDEMSCNCRDTEWQCGSNGPCIEKMWKCDGNRDCPDGSDEASCGTCLSSEFMCRDYRCIPLSDRCNGSPQCQDGSDEDLCVRFSTSSAYLDSLEVRKSSSWYPVCYTNWKQAWSDQVCTMSGQRRAIATGQAERITSAYLSASSSASEDYNHSLLQLTNSCPGNAVVKITCEEKVCGIRSSNLTFPSQYIIGGEVAHPGAWPWSVSIQYLGRHWCGGVLIDSQWVLTAAHCFYYNNARNMTSLMHYFRVVVGANNLVDGSGKQVKVAAVILHPQHKLREYELDDNDIAMVKLATDLPMTDYVRTVCIPPQTIPVNRYRVCFLTGWGLSNKWLQSPAMEMREAKFQIWRHSDCSAPSAWGSAIQEDRMMCAGYQSGNIAACHGDSGSPLVCLDGNERWSLLGIVSHGPSDCGTKPSVLSKVDFYRPWVQQKIQQNK